VQDLPEDLLADTAFANKLLAIAIGWNKEIEALTRLDKDAPTSSAALEVNFWAEMDGALANLEELLKSDGVGTALCRTCFSAASATLTPARSPSSIMLCSRFHSSHARGAPPDEAHRPRHGARDAEWSSRGQGDQYARPRQTGRPCPRW